MADHSNFFNGQASIQAAWRYVQAMDKGKFVSTVNEISGNIPKLPVPSAVVAPLDDFYGGISKEFLTSQKDLLTLVGMLPNGGGLRLVHGPARPSDTAVDPDSRVDKLLRALESKNPAAIKSMLMYLLVMATFNTAEQTLALVLHAIPFYGLVKMGFLFLCSMPSTEVSMKVFGAVEQADSRRDRAPAARARPPPLQPPPTQERRTPHSFAVIVKEATIEIAANAADAAAASSRRRTRRAAEAEAEAAGPGRRGGGSSGFRAMAAGRRLRGTRTSRAASSASTRPSRCLPLGVGQQRRGTAQGDHHAQAHRDGLARRRLRLRAREGQRRGEQHLLRGQAPPTCPSRMRASRRSACCRLRCAASEVGGGSEWAALHQKGRGEKWLCAVAERRRKNDHRRRQFDGVQGER